MGPPTRSFGQGTKPTQLILSLVLAACCWLLSVIRCAVSLLKVACRIDLLEPGSRVTPRRALQSSKTLGHQPSTGRPSNSTRLLFNGGCRYYSELTFEGFRVGLRRCGDLLGHERLPFLLLEFINMMRWRRTVVAATVSSCCCCGNSFA